MSSGLFDNTEKNRKMHQNEMSHRDGKLIRIQNLAKPKNHPSWLRLREFILGGSSIFQIVKKVEAKGICEGSKFLV